jgi:hypothetical protein
MKVRTPLPMLLLVVGLGGAVRSQAQGTIVYSGPTRIPVFGVTFPPTEREIDLDGNGTPDLRFSSSGMSFTVLGLAASRVLGTPSSPLDFDTMIAPPLPRGYEINSTPELPLRWISPTPYGDGQLAGSVFMLCNGVTGTCSGPIRETGFMAFELAINGQAHYGWLEVEIPLPDLIAGGRVLGWAYNTVPGQSIFVAQVPEPTTWILLLLGGGFIVCQKRRQV